MLQFAVPVALFIQAFVVAQSTSPGTDSANGTIDRGLAFLVKDALAWKANHNCVSCHHASLVVWALREAKSQGHAVNEPVLTDLTRWVAESGDGTTGVPRPAGIPKALNSKAVWFALALAADRAPDVAVQRGLKLFWNTIKKDQTDRGSWAAWPETRPPIFGDSDDSMTTLATLALVSAAARGDSQAGAARDRAVRWLTVTKSDGEMQSVAMRLVLWKKLDRPAEEWMPLARTIIERQNEDGGWSQTKGMSSDAWATGQALYALASAGLRPSEPAVLHGQGFLIKSQRDDGSWPMTSRPTKPGGLGSTSLIPITGAGSAWAVLGLARSSRAWADAKVSSP